MQIKDIVNANNSFLDRSPVRLLAANCLSKQEKFYQHAIGHRLRRFNLKQERLEFGSITDLSNYCNLIEIKKESRPNFRSALGQINDYSRQMKRLNMAHPEIQKIIILFSTKQNKMNDAYISSWQMESEMENVSLIRISDPLEYLDDFIAWSQLDDLSSQIQGLKLASSMSSVRPVPLEKKIRPRICKNCSEAMCLQENGCLWRKLKDGRGQCIRYNNHIWEDPDKL